ncbi:helix-turn-helix domain-containing protein [Lactiplantibacillus pentosus]|uniref:XRE family transcriptional regulator n=1 Tax=Lactiplantibacillus pentosus TaxID=1589 RepID=A0AB37RHY0_LACPE|nr:helix-turn-helix transcriptional regulator [Lactiplantibacillus pentosus]RMW42520.1 XRE family transcriptional regulator [Lactiplantibacillus pentosus]RMW48309.1 XRE family transcriptional regulator [Lactiplantibacillus pentosus]RMW52447.1 XRE family transcriptional regulator [Lactiplantibacillus pentosus]RMW55181.1 XRE family transcriptional regulator [Lactiplantibacillus pentosus]
MNNTVVIENIKKWLKQTKSSQVWLAEQIQVSPTMLSQMLKGERKIQTKHLIGICKVTGMTPNQLAKDENKQDSNEPAYVLMGELPSRESTREFKKLLLDIKSYVDLEAMTHE